MTLNFNSHSALKLLENRINLRTVPFTERNSRLLLFQGDDGLWLGQAEYETPVRDTVVFSKFRLTDAAGGRLEPRLTSYPDHLRFEAEVGTFRLTFADPKTLLLALPTGRFGLRFDTPFVLDIDAQGGTGTQGELCLSYTTNAEVRRNEVMGQRVRLELDADTNNVLTLNLTRTAPERPLPDAEAALAASQTRWSRWFGAVPEVLDNLKAQYYFAWWVLGVNLLRLRYAPDYEGMVPSKLGYVGLWHWDAYFHALGLRHADLGLAQNQFRLLLEHQLENGMIPDVVHDTGVLASSGDMVASDREKSLEYVGADSAAGQAMMRAPITKPPLTAWAAWKLFETGGDRAFLREVYEPIVASQAWWFRENDTDGNGLCEYLHPYSSGIDDGPLWDEGPPVEAPELNSYLCLQYDHLAKIAEVLGKPEAKHWQQEAERLARQLIQTQWDAEAGLFWATRYSERIPARTPFNLYPLITGRMPQEIADRLVATLTDPEQFWTTYPVPTVALNDPSFDPERMWRGPVWLNPNYLLIDGLERTGYPEVAAALRRKTLELITDTLSDMAEYYDPVTGLKAPKATVMFGWTSALFIDLALEETRETLKPLIWKGRHSFRDPNFISPRLYLGRSYRRLSNRRGRS